MKEFKKSWNDLIFLLKETPNSPEILAEIKSIMEKFKTDLGSEEYAKIEGDLNKEFEEAKSYVKSNQPIINRNDEEKFARAEAQVKQHTNSLKASENKNEEPSKKGFKKIQIFEEEEEIPEEKSNNESETSKNKKESEPESNINADLSNIIVIIKAIYFYKNYKSQIKYFNLIIKLTLLLFNREEFRFVYDIRPTS